MTAIEVWEDNQSLNDQIVSLTSVSDDQKRATLLLMEGALSQYGYEEDWC